MNIPLFLLTNFLNGVLGICLLLMGFFIFDKITPNWSFINVFKEKGISGGSIIVSSFLIGLSIIIAATGF